MIRQCGDCSLCCRLLPVRTLDKGANTRCKYQRHSGCQVYHKPGMPPECAIWNCRWLVNDDAANLSRPDRSHYVVDLMPDFVEATDNETGAQRNIQVVQIWVDPRHPEAWRDPDLLSYLKRRGEEGMAAVIRYNAKDAFVLMPPALCSNGEFNEVRNSTPLGRDHKFAEIIEVVGRRNDGGGSS